MFSPPSFCFDYRLGVANKLAFFTAEELERIVTIIQNPTQYKIPSCTIFPDPPEFDTTTNFLFKTKERCKLTWFDI